MSWTAVLDSVETILGSVTGINYASRAALIDPERLLRIPRWPKALVYDIGGSINGFNGETYERQFGVAIVVLAPRGTEGKKASQELGTLSEAVVTALTHTRGAGTIRIIADTFEAAGSVGEQEIYMQNLIFSYEV